MLAPASASCLRGCRHSCLANQARKSLSVFSLVCASGTASTFLGVAGGELLIPTLIFAFGADIHTAGSVVLFISIPTVCMGLFRYSRMGLLPGRSTLVRFGLPMGIESLVGAAAGGAFAGSTSAEVLKLLLGLILIAAALKAFWRPQ